MKMVEKKNTMVRGRLYLKDISYGTGKEHTECSGLVLALLAFYGILEWPTKGHIFWPNLLLKINSDQNICLCVFLDVQLKIVQGAWP